MLLQALTPSNFRTSLSLMCSSLHIIPFFSFTRSPRGTTPLSHCLPLTPLYKYIHNPPSASPFNSFTTTPLISPYPTQPTTILHQQIPLLPCIFTTPLPLPHFPFPTMPPKKLRCTFTACKEPAQRIVGDCTFCGGHFCQKHRMLEAHQCSGLEACKRAERERNAAKLKEESTQVRKMG